LNYTRIVGFDFRLQGDNRQIQWSLIVGAWVRPDDAFPAAAALACAERSAATVLVAADPVLLWSSVQSLAQIPVQADESDG